MSSTLTEPIWTSKGVALAVALVAALLAASLFYTPLPLVILLVVPASFYFISRPYELLLVMVFLIPFNFVFTIASIPVAVELLKVFAWIPFLVHLHQNRQRFESSKHNKWFAVWGVILVLSLVRSNNLAYTIKEAVRLASNFGLVYLVVNLIDSSEKFFQVLRVLTFSAFLVACYGFYQFAIQDYGALFWLVNPRIDTSLAPNRVAFWEWRGRIISVLTSELELAHYFNLCLPISLALWITEGRKRLSSKWLWMALSILVGLVLTFTFGAWLALLATLGCFLLLLERRRVWKPLLVGALILSFIVFLLVAGPLRPFVEDKVLGTNLGSAGFDIVARFDSWLFAMQVWWSHPFLGVGIGNFEKLEYEHEYLHSEWVQIGSTPQNAYVYLLALSGIVGLWSILAILMGTIRTNLRMRNRAKMGAIALSLAFALTTTVFASLTDDGPLFGPHAAYLFWLFIGLSETARNLVNHDTVGAPTVLA
jgi:putative inorganic carbon (hco3(-)) transporter